MLETTAILLVRGQHEYILQHRDNKPTIADPDTYSTWGGRVEPHDSTCRDAAVRELKEETGLVCRKDALIYLGYAEIDARSPDIKGQRLTIHHFALEVPAAVQVKVLEGQGIVQITKPYRGNPSKVNQIARETIRRYENQA